MIYGVKSPRLGKGEVKKRGAGIFQLSRLLHKSRGHRRRQLRPGLHQVAVLEAKRKAGKEGIDQLNGVTDQRTLGTYTRKLLVSATPLDDNNLALAAAHRIDVVVLESGRESALSAADRAKLIDVITGMLGVRQ